MTTAGLVLVAEDEQDIQELIDYNLRREGFKTILLARGDGVFEAAIQRKPQLILLDLMLPGLSGAEVCKKLRASSETTRIPIIMVTAKSSEADKISGLDLGADDYVAKPFSIRELLARVRAVLRRADVRERADRSTATAVAQGQKVLEAEGIRLDVEGHEVFCRGEPVSLTFTEFKLLRYLMQERGKAMSRQQLVGLIMGVGVSVTARAIDVHMASLRKKMTPVAELIETVRGVGYRFKK
jgi:DNA-binding response OmpR family regulator